MPSTRPSGVAAHSDAETVPYSLDEASLGPSLSVGMETAPPFIIRAPSIDQLDVEPTPVGIDGAPLLTE
ncbi:hypothetical protein P4O66_018288 [Electrophorus voltai]|uniref:Uncharacterized protein n=1 Tax=Electrophorus voltai TaxID=2609070 RepID=A0AAD8YP91_9TELE|nr:hypothetical protein P4O66_018288 [Electrophorus voltai]